MEEEERTAGPSDEEGGDGAPILFIVPAGEREMRDCLRFLALETPDKRAYLPPPFPMLTFHMGEGDLHTESPLDFMLGLCEDALRGEERSPPGEAG